MQALMILMMLRRFYSGSRPEDQINGSIQGLACVFMHQPGPVHLFFSSPFLFSFLGEEEHTDEVFPASKPPSFLTFFVNILRLLRPSPRVIVVFVRSFVRLSVHLPVFVDGNDNTASPLN